MALATTRELGMSKRGVGRELGGEGRSTSIGCCRKKKKEEKKNNTSKRRGYTGRGEGGSLSEAKGCFNTVFHKTGWGEEEKQGGI